MYHSETDAVVIATPFVTVNSEYVIYRFMCMLHVYNLNM